MKNEVIREAREGSALSSSIFSLGQLVQKVFRVILFLCFPLLWVIDYVIVNIFKKCSLLFVQRVLTCTWSVGWTAGPGRTTSSGWRRWWWWWWCMQQINELSAIQFYRDFPLRPAQVLCMYSCGLGHSAGPSLATNIHTLTKFLSN